MSSAGMPLIRPGISQPPLCFPYFYLLELDFLSDAVRESVFWPSSILNFLFYSRAKLSLFFPLSFFSFRWISFIIHSVMSARHSHPTRPFGRLPCKYAFWPSSIFHLVFRVLFFSLRPVLLCWLHFRSISISFYLFFVPFVGLLARWCCARGPISNLICLSHFCFFVLSLSFSQLDSRRCSPMLILFFNLSLAPKVVDCIFVV